MCVMTYETYISKVKTGDDISLVSHSVVFESSFETKKKCFYLIKVVLWGCASKSNIAIMQRYQSKILRLITAAPRYVNNQTLHTDLQIPFVHTVFQDHIRKHRNTLESHPNPLVEPILHSENKRRLKRRWTFDATN